MSATKCVVCGQRKAKRYCPAKAGQICSTCCGTKRVIEIQCPSDCVYLTSGREHRAQALFAKQRSKMDITRQKKHQATLERFEELLGAIQYTLVAERKSYKRMTDAEALEAVTLLAKTYETETKGVIYEHAAQNPDVQAIIRAIQAAIQAYRKENSTAPLTAQNLLDCMEYLRDEIDFHIQEDVSPTSYLEFLTPFFPSINKQAQASRLIIPGMGR